jgi:hypothetical protein
MNQFNPSRKAQHNASNANEDWSTLTVQVSSSYGHQQVLVAPPKKNVEKTNQINMKDLTTKDDLATLKKNDPFMYYSIPAVRDAAYLLEEVDLSNFEKSSIRRNCISCPSRMQTEGISSTRTVERRTCISFECHADLLMADFLDDDDEEDDEEEKKQEEDNDIDMLLNAMRRISNSK